jgi:hypothetical protein
MKKFNYYAALIDTHLFDWSKENGNDRRVYKAYFLEDIKRGELWKDGEIATMVQGLRNSPLLAKNCAGSIICFADLEEGYSKFFYSKLNRAYLVNGPLVIRNINVQPVLNYSEKDAITVAKNRVPEMTCRAENAIQTFDQGLLCKKGLEAFKTEWIPETVFPSRKSVEL